MSDIPTPLTDALEKVDRDEWDKYYEKHADDSFDEFLVYDIARQFERELAVSNEEIERLRALLRFAWADDDILVLLNESARRAYTDAIREELGMEAIK